MLTLINHAHRLQKQRHLGINNALFRYTTFLYLLRRTFFCFIVVYCGIAWNCIRGAKSVKSNNNGHKSCGARCSARSCSLMTSSFATSFSLMTSSLSNRNISKPLSLPTLRIISISWPIIADFFTLLSSSAPSSGHKWCRHFAIIEISPRTPKTSLLLLMDLVTTYRINVIFVSS